VSVEEELPPGWLTQFRRGVFSGAGLLLLAVALCALPAFLIWLLPGADTTTATAAVKGAGLLALSGAHGGIRLNGQPVTLAPLLVTILLASLVVSQARRSESSASSVVGLAVGYGLASGLLAGWARLGATRAPVASSLLAGLLFVTLVGGGARAWDALGPRLTQRQRRIGRAALAIGVCYLAMSALLVGGSLAWHLGTAAELQRQVAPGVAGLPVALLGLAAVPNALIAGTGYLTGPGVHLGSHTAVSALAVEHGPLPAFPLLAAVPTSASPLLGLSLIAVTGLLAGYVSLRLVSVGRWSARLLDAAAAAVLAGGSLAAGAALAGGGIGTGALAQVGSAWWAVGAGAVAFPALAAGLWTLVAHLRPAWLAGRQPVSPAEPEPVRPTLRAVAGSRAEATRDEPAGQRPSNKGSRQVS